MTPCFESCPLNVEFEKVPYEGKRCSYLFYYLLVKETIKYGNQKKHDLTKEDVLELFD